MKFSYLSRNMFIGCALILVLAGCREGEETDNYDNTAPVNAKSSAADNLKTCTSISNTTQSCGLDELTLLGMDSPTPTVEDIMDRVLVSHPWMTDRFEILLGRYPESMLQLFASVTAIVIDDDIRPSHYSPKTGAIYLDPANLWLSLEEKAVVSKQADFRSGFADPLAFRTLRRYSIDNQSIYHQFGSLHDDSVRTIDDIIIPVARVLLHELAHANDFFPQEMLPFLDFGKTIEQVADEGWENRVSARLAKDIPLESEALESLAAVMFLGEMPTVSDLEMTGIEVGLAFAYDGAADPYAYSSVFEDTATLFEEVMVYYYFGAEYDLAFTGVPEDSRYCDEYQIEWGVRNRIGDDLVRERARIVTNSMMPHVNLNMFYDQLPSPKAVPGNGTWCLPNEEAAEQQRQGAERPKIDDNDLLRPYL